MTRPPTDRCFPGHRGWRGRRREQSLDQYTLHAHGLGGLDTLPTDRSDAATSASSGRTLNPLPCALTNSPRSGLHTFCRSRPRRWGTSRVQRLVAGSERLGRERRDHMEQTACEMTRSTVSQ
jgi:hypothetical protein